MAVLFKQKMGFQCFYKPTVDKRLEIGSSSDLDRTWMLAEDRMGRQSREWDLATIMNINGTLRRMMGMIAVADGAQFHDTGTSKA